MTLDEIQNLADIEQVELFQNMLISRATGGDINENEYKILRNILINNSLIKDLLPKWIHTHRDVNQFWQFIKNKFRTYAERRAYLWEEFSPLLSYLEKLRVNPSLTNISTSLKKLITTIYIIFGKNHLKEQIQIQKEQLLLQEH